MGYKKVTALAGAGALLAMSASGAFALSANYGNAATIDGDEDAIANFNLYDMAVGATLIRAAATNTGDAGNPVVGDRFTGYYQSYVTSHQLGGLVQDAPGLNTSGIGGGYEITVVAQFEEEVSSVGPGGYTSTITGGTATMYFDTTPDLDFTTDSGFTDGDVLLTGSIVSGGAVSAPSLFSGFAQIDIVVDSHNSDVFDPDIAAAQGIFTLDLRSNVVVGLSSVGGNAVQPGDLVLGADGNLQVQPVPLPATAWLLGSAIVGMATLRRRNNAA
ncbi:MAG: flocculation-associated PEP-CTERM protein PepA [Gammaproteobacteria bacterium]